MKLCIDKNFDICYKLAIKEVNEINHSVPKILFVGKTGTGKSSLINSLCGQNLCQTGVIPTTRDIVPINFCSTPHQVTLLDAEGFGEAEKIDNIANNMEVADGYIEKIKAKAPDLIVLVTKCGDTELIFEKSFLRKFNEYLSLKNYPIIIAFNQIDKALPCKENLSTKINFDMPNTSKEKNIIKSLNYLAESLNVLSNFSDLKSRIVPVAAGETYHGDTKYGIEDLKQKIYINLPVKFRKNFAACFGLKNHEIKRIALKYSKLNLVEPFEYQMIKNLIVIFIEFFNFKNSVMNVEIIKQMLHYAVQLHNNILNYFKDLNALEDSKLFSFLTYLSFA